MKYSTVGALALLFAFAASPAASQSTALGPQGCAALRTLELTGIALSEITATIRDRVRARASSNLERTLSVPGRRWVQRPPQHADWPGCGGRFTRVGAPAMRTNYAVLGTDWINVQLNRAAPRGADGNPVTANALSSTQKQAVIEGIRDACDANDGVTDGLVYNQSARKFDPQTLVCGGKNRRTCPRSRTGAARCSSTMV